MIKVALYITCLLHRSLLVIIISTCAAFAQENSAVNTELKNALEQIVSQSEIPGISVAITSDEGLIWSGVAGYSIIEDQKPVSQAHMFGIGDISNLFVGAVVTQLVAEGFLELSDTPYSILGEKVANIANADSATISQLLDHTSGIYSWDNDPDWARRSRGIQLNPSYRWEKEETLKYITKDRHPATGEPGEKYSFSKSNYTLLGLIIERATGGLLEDEMRTRILTPLGLNSTYYDTYEPVPLGSMVGNYQFGSDEFISRVGVNAKFQFEDGRLLATTGTSLSAEGVGSGIVSTSRDVAIFARELWSNNFLKNNDETLFLPPKINNNIGIHSEILGYTADVRKIEHTDLIIVSLVNISAVQTGENEVKEYLDGYVENILIPIAKKYASAN